MPGGWQTLSELVSIADLSRRTRHLFCLCGTLFMLPVAGVQAQSMDASTTEAMPQRGLTVPALLADPDISRAHYLPDFSYAGYEFGLGMPGLENPTVISVTDHGAKPDDEMDDSKGFLAALAAAEELSGPVVIDIPAGRFIISEILPLQRSSLVLRGRGQGDGGTILYFPRPLSMVDETKKLDELRKYLVKFNKRQVEKARNIDVLFSEYSWSGGFIWVGPSGNRPAPYLPEYDRRITKLADVMAGERGGLSLTVKSAGRLSPGDVVQVQWFNRQGKDGPLLEELYGEEDIRIGSHHWTFPKRPLVVQITRIKGIEGQTVQIEDPLLHPVSDTIPAQISQWQHLREVGIEDLQIEFPNSPYYGHHMEAGYNGIYFTGVFNGWIRNIKVTGADSGILTYDSANVTISNITSAGDRPAHYAVHIGNVHNILVSGLNVFNPVIHSLTFNTQSTRSVYKDATVYAVPALDQHAGSNHQNLFDNITVHVTAKPGEDGQPVYPLFDGSGAGYWQPGHGMFNTAWNLKVWVESGAAPGETVTLQGLDEGPAARVVGITGNRPFDLDYRPSPYVELVNEAPTGVPSLYDYQLAQRKNQETE